MKAAVIPTEVHATARRVAVVAACTFPAPRGSQVLVRAVVEQLAAAGHQVHLITYASGESYDPPAGVRVHASRLTGVGAAPIGLGWSKVRYDIELLVTLRRVVMDERIEIVHAHNYEAPLLAYWVRASTGVPVVYHAHNALADELATYVRPGWRRRLARWMGRRLDGAIPRRADFCIALTPELGAFLVRCGVDPSRMAVIAPHGLPADGITRTEFVPVPGCFKVTYAGNLDPYQDLDVLGDAFARLREAVPYAHLCLVTHAADWRERLEPRFVAWIRAGVVTVHVVSSYASVWREMLAADVLVCPRSSWSGYPIKLVNYAAAGRPIVVAAGSAKGFVDQESALVVGNRDPGAFAAALQRLHDEPGLAPRLGAAAERLSNSLGDGAEIASKFGAIYGKIRDDDERTRVSRAGRLLAWAGERISAVAPIGGPR